MLVAKAEFCFCELPNATNCNTRRLLCPDCARLALWRLAAVVDTFNAHAIAANDECGGRADAGNWLVPPVAARS